VPMLIISPYARRGYISHTLYEFGSVLKTIEERFGLVPLTQRDALANDLTDSFDFSQAPRAGHVLQLRNCPLLSAANVDFGRAGVGTTSEPITVMLSNSRTTPLQISSIATTGVFNQTNTCPGTLTANASCNINVTFSPTGSRALSGDLTVTDSDSTSPQVAKITGIGSYLNLSPSGLIRFGNQNIGTTSHSQTVTLSNSGSLAVNISSITTVGPFSQTNTCGTTLAGLSSCSVYVSSAPSISGTHLGNLVIFDDALGSPQTVRLQGAGVALSFSPASNLDFGNQPVGEPSAPKTIKLTNLGNTTLSIGGVSISGPFSQTNDCGSGLVGGAKCTITVTFTPTQVGSLPGSLVVSDSDGTSPQTVTLTGTGT